MPFIADRTFPIPAATTDLPTTTRVDEAPPPSVAGAPPATGPQSPAAAPKPPPPPPRTVSVKSSSPGAPQSPTSEPPLRSSHVSSSESFARHSERFSGDAATTRSPHHEYSTSDTYETSTNYGRQSEDGATRTAATIVPVQTMSHCPPRQVVVGDFNSHQQHFQYPVTAPVLIIIIIVIICLSKYSMTIEQ